MKKCFVFILVLPIFTACFGENQCKKVSIPLKEKEWFEAYKTVDRIIFLNKKSNQRDTFELDRKLITTYSPCNRFELGRYQFESNKIKFKATKCHGNNKNFCSFQLSITMDYDFKARGSVRFFRVYDLNSGDNEVTRMIKPSWSKDSIETLYFEKGTSGFAHTSKFIRSFNWSKKFGLLQYTTLTGEVYELVKQ